MIFCSPVIPYGVVPDTLERFKREIRQGPTVRAKSYGALEPAKYYGAGTSINDHE